jgi:hypothetical protein
MVMHASAALGAVVYNRNGTFWTTSGSFQYELRDPVYNNEVEVAMSKYFTSNGWVANNSSIGKNTTIEFKIDISAWKEPLYLACVFAEHDLTLHSFPTPLTDDAVLPKLVQGYTPDSLRFEPGKWRRVE